MQQWLYGVIWDGSHARRVGEYLHQRRLLKWAHSGFTSTADIQRIWTCMVWSWTLVQNQPLPRSWYQLFQVSQHPSKKDTKRDVCFWDSSATCICGVCHFCTNSSTKQSCNWPYSKSTCISVKIIWKAALKLLHWVEAVNFVRVTLLIHRNSAPPPVYNLFGQTGSPATNFKPLFEL